MFFPLVQVLEVVRSHYDTLTLKLQDGLDQFERYSEQPKEAAFFKELVRDQTRSWIRLSPHPAPPSVALQFFPSVLSVINLSTCLSNRPFVCCSVCPSFLLSYITLPVRSLSVRCFYSVPNESVMLNFCKSSINVVFSLGSHT